jgi:hypothetical protein
MAQLYPRALGSLSVATYGLQGCGGGGIEYPEPGGITGPPWNGGEPTVGSRYQAE